MPEEFAWTSDCGQCGALIAAITVTGGARTASLGEVREACPNVRYIAYNGEMASDNILVYGSDGGLYCSDDCIDDAMNDGTLFECEDCNDMFNDEIRYSAADRTVCEGCLDSYVHCTDCDEYMYSDSATWFEQEQVYRCEHHTDVHGMYCEACEQMVYCDDATSIENMLEPDVWLREDYSMEDVICERCDASMRRNSPPVPTIDDCRYIQYYSYRPGEMVIRRYGSKDGIEKMAASSYRGIALQRVEHYFGMEMEVEPQEELEGDVANTMEAAKYVTELYEDFFYCKRDASVERGFEAVSHPASFDWWMGRGRELLIKMTNKLAHKYGFRSHGSGRCGLHIHTNKASLSHIQLKRMIEFMYDKRRNKWIMELSRRGGHEAMDYANLKFIRGTYDYEKGEIIPSKTPLRKAAIDLVKNDKMGGERCNALNLSGDLTVELRLVRGTLNHDSLLAALQFYDALIQVCDPKGEVSGLQAPTLSDFRGYCKRHAKRYNEFNYMMEAQGLCA